MTSTGETATHPVGTAPQFDEFEAHRRELTGYCYRMLGSGSEAEDAVQETLLRAWRSADRFAGRSSVRTWLYRIATNVCTDMGRSPQRRARPMDLGPSRPPDPAYLGDMLPDGGWVTPIRDASVIDLDGDPAEVAAARESIRLAFVGALQLLPAKQRAALVLCEVLKWPAADVAELLDTSTASVNSALQRARVALAAGAPSESVTALSAEQQAVISRYVDAFERYDMDALASLLHDDVVQTMPPYAMWFQGRDDVVAFHRGIGSGCRGSRLLESRANGAAAFAQYRVDPAGGHMPWSLQVIELRGDRIAGIHGFLDTGESFERFGFPPHLD